jgi:hypothetical protein
MHTYIHTQTHTNIPEKIQKISLQSVGGRLSSLAAIRYHVMHQRYNHIHLDWSNAQRNFLTSLRRSLQRVPA